MAKPTTIEDALLEDIRDNLDDDTPRLIFADWLEDNGDPDRAEFICAQIEREGLRARSRRAKALWRREVEILQRRSAEWVGLLQQVFGLGYTFKRGLLEVSLDGTRFADADVL